MGQVRDTATKLYEAQALLGFFIVSIEGEMLHNESFFSDEAALQVMTTLAGCINQLVASGREVLRLTVELDDVILICTHITDRDRYGLFILRRTCDLDNSAADIVALTA